ncbi:MAG: substrate-binding domain-containing protein [Candidatus Peribacteria bacterium]|nr:substrate-binding domain-containing protein [Candidatus Peribacteria bacterium]
MNVIYKHEKTMKRCLQIFLTFAFTIGYIYTLYILEYWQEIKNVDNIVGALPLFCFTTLLIFCILLVWKFYKNFNIILLEIIIVLILTSILSIAGNWYITKDNDLPFSSPDLTVYEPFKENTQTAQLSDKASLFLDDNLPTLDGATALYPVYTSFVNAVYNEEKYTPEIAVCTNTNNAYRRIIDGDVDIIFVAGASELQQKEAEKIGVNLVFTPIGKEAFVFLVAKSNPINNLSYQQIKNIYSGKTRYWKTLSRKNGSKMLVFRRPE